jgi:divalent metal cation (Fe/Co/Zn/Cd) transporter
MNALEGFRRAGKAVAYVWAAVSAIIVFFTWREGMQTWNRALLQQEWHWSNFGSALINAVQAAGVCLIIYAVAVIIGNGLGWITRGFLAPRHPVA